MLIDSQPGKITENIVARTLHFVENRHGALGIITEAVQKLDNLEIEGLQPGDDLNILSKIGFQKKKPN